MLIDGDKLVCSVIGRSIFVNVKQYNFTDKLLDYRLHVMRLKEGRRYPKDHFNDEITAIDEILKAFTN